MAKGRRVPIGRLPDYWFILATGATVAGKQRDVNNPLATGLLNLWRDQLIFALQQQIGMTGGGRVREPMVFGPRPKPTVY